MRRSSVQRMFGFSSGCRRRITASTPIVWMPGDAFRIGTTSASKIAACGSGRRRSRGFCFCDGRRGSASPRRRLARRVPALADAIVVSWVVRIGELQTQQNHGRCDTARTPESACLTGALRQRLRAAEPLDDRYPVPLREWFVPHPQRESQFNSRRQIFILAPMRVGAPPPGTPQESGRTGVATI